MNFQNDLVLKKILAPPVATALFIILNKLLLHLFRLRNVIHHGKKMDNLDLLDQICYQKVQSKTNEHYRSAAYLNYSRQQGSSLSDDFTFLDQISL